MKDKSTVWIIEEEENTYDNTPTVIAVFLSKPSIEELIKTMYSANGSFGNLMEALAFIHHLHNGGGREGTESWWYTLREIPVGVKLGE